MPVTLKLSRKFYETFGDQVANEFVDAFNQVDATYRSDLKELNEQNFARFDAEQKLRHAELQALIERRFSDQSRFILLGWATTIAAVIGSVIGGAFVLR